MSAPAELIREAADAGLHLELTPDGGVVVKPKNRITPAIVEKLRAEKPALIEYLRAEQSRRRELCRRAVAGLTEQRQRSAVLEHAGDGTYIAAVAVRMPSGGTAVAVLTGIRGDWDQLLLAFERACELPPQ